MKALAINSWALLFCAQLNVVSKILLLNLQWCMTICRVHLSTDLWFSKFHLHGSMVIKIINTMESPVHPNNFWEMRWTVQSVSKKNKYRHWSPFCCFFNSFSFLCFNSAFIQGSDFLLIKSLAPFIVKSFSTLQRPSGDTLGGWGKQHLCSSPFICTVSRRPWSEPLSPIQPQPRA